MWLCIPGPENGTQLQFFSAQSDRLWRCSGCHMTDSSKRQTPRLGLQRPDWFPEIPHEWRSEITSLWHKGNTKSQARNPENLNIMLMNYSCAVPYVFSVVKLLSPSLASTSTSVAVQTIIIFIFYPRFLSWQYTHKNTIAYNEQMPVQTIPCINCVYLCMDNIPSPWSHLHIGGNSQ